MTNQAAVLLSVDSEGTIVIQTTEGMSKEQTLEVLQAVTLMLQDEQESETSEPRFGSYRH